MCISMDVRWRLGRNLQCSLWNDNWLAGRSLSSTVNIPQSLNFMKKLKGCDLMENGAWKIPEIFKHELPISKQMEHTTIEDVMEDELLWEHSNNGVLTIKSAYEQYRQKLPK